jgi:hypothetical protein
MKKSDAEQRENLIAERHKALDCARAMALEAKESQIEKNLEVGKEIRSISELGVKRRDKDIRDDKRKVLEWKRGLRDRAPAAVAKAKQRKLQTALEQRRTVLQDLALARRIERERVEAVKQHADRVRDEMNNHLNPHGDVYTSKRELTEPRFLMEMNDDEAVRLTELSRKVTRRWIATRIGEHRKGREGRISRNIELMEAIAQDRQMRDEEHRRLRDEKKLAEDTARRRKEKQEDEKVILLELKRQKRIQSKLEEAKEMEEQSRIIEARSRYLATNKQALEEKGFESLQNARLRTAKERQTRLFPIEPAPIHSKPDAHADLAGLRVLLGLKKKADV